jgi:hypothetical protein
MPLCVICKEMYPSTYVFTVGEDVEGKTEYKCEFCETMKDELIEYGVKSNRKVTKQQVIKEYKNYLHDLKEDNGKIKQMLTGEEPSRIIMP